MGKIERIKKEEKKKPKLTDKLSIKKLSKREEFFEMIENMKKMLNQNK